MTNTALNNKRFGFNAEAELLQYFRDHGLISERLHLAGTEDEGDLTVQLSYSSPIVVQLKTFAARSAKGEDRPLPVSKVKGWWKDLKAQREAYRAHRDLRMAPPGLLVVKVKGQSWDDAMVIRRLGDWVGHD
jgi:hypothetical protein